MTMEKQLVRHELDKITDDQGDDGLVMQILYIQNKTSMQWLFCEYNGIQINQKYKIILYVNNNTRTETTRTSR